MAVLLGGAPQTALADPTQVSIGNMVFEPAILTIHPGDSIVWTNNDGLPHTVTFRDKSPSSRVIAHGQAFTRVFDRAGTYEYFCAIHPNMIARVVVTEQ